jgi:hypothetical protein
MTEAAKRHLSAVPSFQEETTPSKAQSAKYKHFADSYRSFKALGSKYEIEAMFVLLDFERTSVCWRTSPKVTFNEVLREERFCTIRRYNAFKQATVMFGKPQIKRLGVDAVCLIARQPAKYRPRLIEKSLKFRSSFAQEPTYQYASQLIESMLPKKKAKPTYGTLKKFVESLKEEVRRLGGKIPKMEA